MPDFTVTGGGSLYILTPHTDIAKEWIAEHIGEHQSWCGGVAVEHRYFEAIFDGIINDGWEVSL